MLVHPLKSGAAPTTPFGVRGYSWSCHKDASGRGIHTGADWAAPTGTPVYAVVAGDIRYRSYGSAFGLQLAVSPDGPGEWFYAHLSWRVPDGARVEAGDLVGHIGSTGNSTGPHLHLEWHPAVKNRWDCTVHADPWPEVSRLGTADEAQQVHSSRNEQRDRGWLFSKGHQIHTKYLTVGGHMQNADQVSDSVKALQEMLNRHQRDDAAVLRLTGKYARATDAEVIKCQTQHGFGVDRPGRSFVRPAQLAHLLSDTNAPYTAIDDRPKRKVGEQSAGAQGMIRFLTFDWSSGVTGADLAGDRQLWDQLATKADVIGLQQARGVYDKVLQGLDDGRWSFWSPDLGDGRTSGEVLGWRTGLFDTVDTGSTMISPSTGVRAHDADPTLRDEQHVVWADLRHRPTGQVWNLGVVRLVPSRQPDGTATLLWLKQRDALVAWITRQGDRCVVMGDFNCDKRRKEARPVERVATIRTATSHADRRVDWIVVKNAAGVASTAGRGLPNRGRSDHKPVRAMVTIAAQERPGLRGIDISSHQRGIDLAVVDADFVIVKATEGRTYVSPAFREQYAAAKAAGRLLGLYHFAAVNEPEVEADFFVDTIGRRAGEAVLVLDWERPPLDDVDWCDRWVNRVRLRTGVRPMIYMSEAVANGADWRSVGRQCPLWVAAYRSEARQPNYDISRAGTKPAVNRDAWPDGWVMWQWSRNGALDGYAGPLDVNTCTLSAAEWEQLASASA